MVALLVNKEANNVAQAQKAKNRHSLFCHDQKSREKLIR